MLRSTKQNSFVSSTPCQNTCGDCCRSRRNSWRHGTDTAHRSSTGLHAGGYKAAQTEAPNGVLEMHAGIHCRDKRTQVKKDARRKALSSLRVGCSSRVREQQLGSARTAQFFRWDGPSPSSRGLSTPGAPPCSTRRSRASKWMSNGLYQKGRFIVEICTLRAVDIDVRRSLRLLHPHGPCGALAEWRV